MVYKKKSMTVKILTVLLVLPLCFNPIVIWVYAKEKRNISFEKSATEDYITFNRIKDGNRPLQISLAELPINESITDTYIVNKGDICSATFTWNGSGTAKLVLQPLPPIKKPTKEIIIENGVPISSEISDIDGYYMITVINSGSTVLKNFVGELSISNEIITYESDQLDTKQTIPENEYIKIATYSQDSDILQTIIPIKIEQDNKQLQLGFKCDNSYNYLTAFVVPANVNNYFAQQDYLSFIEPYASGIYVDNPFKNDTILKDSVIMISRGFFGSTSFDESQIIAKNTNQKGDYYIYFISQEKCTSSLYARVIPKQ